MRGKQYSRKKDQKREKVEYGENSSFKNSEKRRTKMNYEGTRTIETAISVDNLTAQIGQFLYATGFVHDDEDIVGLEFNAKEGDKIVPIKITIQKEVKPS